MTENRLPADASWLVETNLQDLLGALSRDGVKARVVGGAVRNALAGLPVSDIDVATEFSPDEATEILEDAGFRIVETGKSHGTVTALRNGKNFQVTTLRVDVQTHGRHADVAFTRNWEGDAARRDFTINAIYADADGVLHDPFDGRADLAAGRVRFIGNADARVGEDYLRILRYFRFLAAFGTGKPDRAGLSACIHGRVGIETLSAERVRVELLKLLAVEDCVDAVQAFAHTGILGALLGGVVWPDTLARLAKIERQLSRDPDPLLRLSLLAVRANEDVVRIAARLKLSNDGKTRLDRTLDEAGNLSPKLNVADRKEALYRLGAQSYSDRALCNWARLGTEPDATWRDLYEFPGQWTAPANPFRGEYLLARGIAAGPGVGVILARAERLWIDAGFPAEELSIRKLLDQAIVDKA